jgi:acetoin utilization deacetylase AcuC-like enzyme
VHAARLACGSVLSLVDAVIEGKVSSGFAAIRPPGHHACRDKSMGFCLINNVAVAAEYAIKRNFFEKVAVIDWDVHHGNGTEDILSNDAHVLMVSFFQHPFYPYSGTEKQSSNMVNIPVPAYTRGMDVRDLVEQNDVLKISESKIERVNKLLANIDNEKPEDIAYIKKDLRLILFNENEPALENKKKYDEIKDIKKKKLLKSK